jgi:UDP-glucose 4-epimerase
VSAGKVVVFGGGGFLGSHVADALTRADYAVVVFDQVPSRYLHPAQQMIVGDVMDLDRVRAATADAVAVYNFAAVADLEVATRQPLRTAEVNFLGNVHVLEAAREAGVRRFVFASSAYVFSRVASFYRASKQAAERYIEAYQEEFGLDYTILRYGSLYGRRADQHNGMYRMLKQALEERRITYAGDREAIREYIHVTDAAKLSVDILAPQYANRHLILTGHERLRIADVMLMIAEIMPDAVDISFADPEQLGHYAITPYAHEPRVGHKLVCHDYVDLGQGLLDCIREIEEMSGRNEPDTLILP